MAENNLDNILKVFTNVNGDATPIENGLSNEKIESNNNTNSNINTENVGTNQLEKEENKPTEEEIKKRGRPKKTDTEQQPTQQEKPTETEEINPFRELITYVKTKNNWEDLEFENISDIDEFTDTLNQYLQKKKKPDIKDPLLDILIDYTSKGGTVYDFINNFNKDEIKLNYNFESENDKLKFLYNYCKDTTNWSEEKIKSYLEKTYKSNLLEDELNEAINYYNNKKVEKIKNIIEEQNKYYEEMNKLYEEQFNRYIESINNHSEEIIGEKLDKKTKDEFVSFLFTKNEESGFTKYQEMIRMKPELELKIAYEYFKLYLNTDNEKLKKEKILRELKSQIGVNKNSNQKSANNDIKQTLDNLFKK